MSMHHLIEMVICLASVRKKLALHDRSYNEEEQKSFSFSVLNAQYLIKLTLLNLVQDLSPKQKKVQVGNDQEKCAIRKKLPLQKPRWEILY